MTGITTALLAFLSLTSVHAEVESQNLLIWGTNSFTVEDMRNPSAEAPCTLPSFPHDVAVGGAAVFLEGEEFKEIREEHSDAVLVCGGIDNGKSVDSCHEFNGEAWVESAISLPEGAKWDKTAKLLPVAGDRMWYLVPGNRWNMVLENGAWTQGPFSDGSIDYYCPLQLNSTHTMVTGGYPKEDDYPDTKVSVYNWETMEWSEVAPLNDRRGFHLCASDNNGGAYVLGGNSYEFGDKFSLEHYDAAMDQWTNLGDAPVSGFIMNDLLIMQSEKPVLVVEATSEYHVFNAGTWETHQLHQEFTYEDWGLAVHDHFLPACFQ